MIDQWLLLKATYIVLSRDIPFPLAAEDGIVKWSCSAETLARAYADKIKAEYRSLI